MPLFPYAQGGRIRQKGSSTYANNWRDNTEEAGELQQAYAELKEAAAQKERRIEELEALLMRALLRIEELERRLRKDSHNSSKPPSSDGLARKPRQARKKSEKPSGGQPGPPGQALAAVFAGSPFPVTWGPEEG